MIIFEDNVRFNFFFGFYEIGYFVFSEFDFVVFEGSKGDIGDFEVGYFDVMWGKL